MRTGSEAAPPGAALRLIRWADRTFDRLPIWIGALAIVAFFFAITSAAFLAGGAAVGHFGKDYGNFCAIFFSVAFTTCGLVLAFRGRS